MRNETRRSVTVTEDVILEDYGPISVTDEASVEDEIRQEQQRIANPNPEIDIKQLLKESCPHRVASWLGSTSRKDNREAFIRAADDALFNTAFCTITPEQVLLPLRRVRKHVRLSTEDGHFFNPRLLPMLDFYWTVVNRILMARQEAGHALSLPTIEHALKWAAAVGNLKEASKLWSRLIASELTPTLACYNAQMAAHVNNLAFSYHAATTFRVTERSLEMRSHTHRPQNLWGYITNPLQPLAHRTLKAQCLTLFKDLTQKQLSPNEETFVTLMTALARSGDIAAVSSILKSVWNIDVVQLDAFDEEEVESPTFYEDGHSLRPSAKLLTTIVHAYCINNDATQAWKLLDYTSRNYNLEIPDDAWEELYEWTYVLSVPRGGKKTERGEKDGQLGVDEMDSLIKLMTDEPYKRKLSPVMLHLRSRNLRYRHSAGGALETFRESLKLLHESCDRLQLKTSAIEYIARYLDGHLDNGLLSQAFVQAKVEFEQEFCDVAHQYQLLSQEAQHIISEPSFVNRFGGRDWTRRRLPQAIEELNVWLDGKMTYQLREAYIELEEWTADQEFDATARFSQAYIEGLAVYRVISSLELQWVYQRLKSLPWLLSCVRSDVNNNEKLARIQRYHNELRKNVPY